MEYNFFKSAERGIKDIGWLKSNFTFSFSSFENPLRKGFGLLKVFNDDFVTPKGGFGLHSHQNMEIISVLLAGKMNHKDSMGYTDVVSEDWVQIMSAGSGLRHEEYNVGEEDVNFLQIWIEPKLQNINPRYQRRFFPKAKRENKLTTIVSNEEGAEHCWINQNAKLSLGYFTEKQTIHYSFNPTNKCVYIFLMEGDIYVNDIVLEKRDAIGLWATNNITIEIKSSSSFLVIETPINS